MTERIFGFLSLPVYLLLLWPLVVASRRGLGVRIAVCALVGAAVGWAVAVHLMVQLFPPPARRRACSSDWSSRSPGARSWPR
jgi:ubiquinone biosynthesis protein